MSRISDYVDDKTACIIYIMPLEPELFLSLLFSMDMDSSGFEGMTCFYAKDLVQILN